MYDVVHHEQQKDDDGSDQHRRHGRQQFGYSAFGYGFVVVSREGEEREPEKQIEDPHPQALGVEEIFGQSGVYALLLFREVTQRIVAQIGSHNTEDICQQIAQAV
ncbi:hypothetical protein RDV60_03065 [Porphyromonas gingivalis]|uniref:hypothetical protein n=1 Tax=Porphyromonas gingivalis TaxID=837 RepID=UPI0028531366|nr:hypothetical protein [Porphyromonas gingivalis]MDR4975631.1 hypothetical protein [Porphyromonas gingivalis]